MKLQHRCGTTCARGIRAILVFICLCALWNANNDWPTGWGFYEDDPQLYRYVQSHNPLAPSSGWLYRPVFLTYLKLAFAIFGYNAVPLHILSLCLHAINAALLGALAWRLMRSERLAWLASFLFIVHPNDYEQAVSWIASTSTLLAALFSLSTWHLWLSFRETGKQVFLAAAWIAFALALGSKEEAIIVPASCLVLDWIKSGKSHGVARSLSGFLIVIVLFLPLAITSYLAVDSANPLVPAPPPPQNRLRLRAVLEMFHAQFAGLAYVDTVFFDAASACIISALLWWRKSARPWLAWYWLSFLPLTAVLGDYGRRTRFHYFPTMIATLLCVFCFGRLLEYLVENYRPHPSPR